MSVLIWRFGGFYRRSPNQIKVSGGQVSSNGSSTKFPVYTVLTIAIVDADIMDLLALTLLTLSLWAPPAVRGACVDDDETAFFDDECRTSDRFSADHILPPDWGLLLDSYDFSGLVGTTTVQQWRTLDVDGINEAGISTSSPQDSEFNWILITYYQEYS